MTLTLPSTFVERLRELSPGATKAYLALAWFKATKQNSPTQPEIARYMNASSRSVNTYLKELEGAGHLHKRRLGSGRRTEYILLTELHYGA